MEKKISYTKATYIWSQEKNQFCSKIKIIKSIDNNLTIPSITINNNMDYILQPRCIVNDPFNKDNSILIWCDLLNLDSKCFNYDERINFLKDIKELEENIKPKNIKISFTQRFIIKDKDTFNIDSFIKLSLDCGINIDEISYNKNILEISNNFTELLTACDELLFIRYIISKICSFEFYENLEYKFKDDINDANYIKKLGSKHDLIKKEELFYKTFDNLTINYIDNKSNSYILDKRFIGSIDPFSLIKNNIKLIYT